MKPYTVLDHSLGHSFADVNTQIFIFISKIPKNQGTFQFTSIVLAHAIKSVGVKSESIRTNKEKLYTTHYGRSVCHTLRESFYKYNFYLALSRKMM